MTEREDIPVTSVERTITDTLISTRRTEFARQAIADARREGFLDKEQASRLRRALDRYTPRSDPRRREAPFNQS